MRLKASQYFIALFLIAAVAVPAAAQLSPTSAPVRVNRTSDFKQLNPVAAFGPSDAALVVWENDQKGIRGLFQRLDGTATSAQLTLVANENLDGRYEAVIRNRKDPAVVFLPSGHFLLAWTEEQAYLRASPFFEERKVLDQDVLIQRFDASGAPAGTRFRVNSATDGFQTVPKIALLPNGNALVLWKSTPVTPASQGGIVGRFVNATGQPLGAEIAVSEDPTADHYAVSVGRRGFLVAWDETVGGQGDVFGRLYQTSGRPLGSELRINTATQGSQRWPAVATGADGNFLVAWQSFVGSGLGVHIHGQSVSPAGGFVGPSFLISSNQGTQSAPAVAAAKTGFLVSWLDANYIGYAIKAVELDNLGARVGNEIQVSNDFRVRKNFRKSIAADGKGGFLIPWESEASRELAILARGLRQ